MSTANAEDNSSADARALWLRHGHATVLAATEALRLASEDELLAMNVYINPGLLNDTGNKGANNYVDIRTDAAIAGSPPRRAPALQGLASGHGGAP